MKFKHLALFLLVLAANLPAHAGRVYTPAQLRQMVDSGRFPEQEAPAETTKYVSFNACKETVRSIMAAAQPNYPVRTLMDVSTMLSMKAWTNDGAIVMSCSQDGKFVTQTSKYL